MFELVKYLLIALFIAGLAAAGYGIWHGFTGSYEMKGAQAQLKADQSEIAQANADRDTALTRAQAADAGYAQAKAVLDTQTQALKDAQTLAQNAAKAAREQALLYAAEVARGKARDTKLRAQAGAPPASAKTCEQTLGATDAILRESAGIRQAP